MELSIIDIQDLLHRTMNDTEFAKEILDDYLFETPEMIQRLKIAVDSKDINEIIAYSHKLKGSSASIGALELKEKSETLEKIAKNADINNIQSSISRLIECYAVTIKTIKELEIMK